LEELLEGFTDLTEEWQDKVRKAVEVGHVDDEDWLGDPEFNRPGKKGMTPRKKKVVEEPLNDSEAGSPSSSPFQANEEDTPVKKRPAKKAKVEAKVKSEVNGNAEPAKKKSRAKKVKAEAEDSTKTEATHQVKMEANDNMDLDLPTKKSRAKRVKVEEDEDDGEEEQLNTSIPTKKSRGKKVKEEAPLSAPSVSLTTRSGRRTKAPNYRE
jgi:hypothetical protein